MVRWKIFPFRWLSDHLLSLLQIYFRFYEFWCSINKACWSLSNHILRKCQQTFLSSVELLERCSILRAFKYHVKECRRQSSYELMDEARFQVQPFLNQQLHFARQLFQVEFRSCLFLGFWLSLAAQLWITWFHLIKFQLYLEVISNSNYSIQLFLILHP